MCLIRVKYPEYIKSFCNQKDKQKPQLKNEQQTWRDMICVGKDVEKLELLYSADGSVKWYSTMEDSMAGP